MRGCPDLFMGVEAEYAWVTVMKCSCPFEPSLYKAGYERERGRALHFTDRESVVWESGEGEGAS